MRQPKGSILVVVLFVMVVLGFLAVGFGFRSALERRLARERVTTVQLRAQAASAVAIALSRLAENTNDFDHPAEAWHWHEPLSSEDWLTEWSPGPSGKGPEFAADYEVIDEEGKLNLLYASGKDLEKLGLSPQRVACLTDWMDEDDISQAQGAENQYYETLNPPYQAKNAPLEMLDELLLIRGFDSVAYYGRPDGPPSSQADATDDEGLVRLLTCKGAGKININTAPKRVLQTLPIDEAAVEQIVGYRAFGENSGGKLEDHVFRSAKDIEQLQGLTEADKAVLASTTVFRSRYYRILARASHAKSGLKVSLDVLVDTGKEGPEIIQWKAVNQ